MRFIYYLTVGILFGIILIKSEVVSWFRIFEMFRFESFHMYGIIGSAVITLALAIAWIKKAGMKDYSGRPIHIEPKRKGWKNYLFGGTLFGLGWAMTGACPGPLFALLGKGIMVFSVIILFAILGTLTYGLIRDRLPH